MNREAIREYTTRVTQASKSELTVILYEMTITELNDAKQAFQDNDLAAFEKSLKQAQKYVAELMASLDYRYEPSFELASLYIFVSKSIIKGLMKKDIEYIQSGKSILEKLLVGFEGVSKADVSGPVMSNTQQVYAGLTYGRDDLNETFLDPDNYDRGFRA